MRILYISPRQAWPPVTGAKLRDFYLAKALGTRAELTYVYYGQPGTGAPTERDMPFCRRLVRVDAPGSYTPWKLLRGLFGAWPVTVVNYTSSAMIEALRGAIRQQSFDAVHVDIVHMAACEAAIRPELGNTPVFYNWHNIESELMHRYAERAPMPRRLYAAQTARRLEAVEDRILETASGHVVCSGRERTLLLKRHPQARIATIENGVDTGAFAEDDAAEKRFRILFVGSMNYHANIEGAEWFTRSIWPELRRVFPEAVLTLAGADPAPAVRALAAEPGVEVTGTVPDVRPLYRQAFAAIVPLLSGSGTRLKILEAMAAGVPTVSTAIGAEGLAVTAGENILIAGRPEEWGTALEGLRQQARWNGLASAGRAYAAAYDWNALGERLFATYCGWMGRA